MSSHTSDKDPNSQRSRVFIGNLNTFLVGKEQLDDVYGRFGTIQAVSVHKGYAFVQFESEAEARSAISYTDGTSFGGRVVDVNLVCEPKNKGGAGPQKKRTFDQMAGEQSSDAYGQQAVYGQAYSTNGGAGRQIVTSCEDTLVCGNCQCVFKKWEDFREHRREPCQQKIDLKPEGEPEILYCFICADTHPDGWQLLQHLSKSHNMTVYEAPKA